MEDEKLKEFEKLMQDFNTASFPLGFLDFFSWMKKLPNSVKVYLFHTDVLEHFKEKFLDFFYVSISRKH